MAKDSKELQDLFTSMQAELATLAGTVEALGKEVAAFKKDVTQLNKAIDALPNGPEVDYEERLSSLSGELSEQTETIGRQQKSLQSLTKQVESMAKENTSLKQVINSIPAAALDQQKPEKPTIPTGTFELGGKFKFIAPKFMHNGETVTAKDAMTDPEMLQMLVDKNVGFIEEVYE